MVELADEAAPLLCRSGVEALSPLFPICSICWIMWISLACPSLGALPPPYKGGGGRLTCRVLLGLGYLLQVGQVSPLPILTRVGLLGFLLMGLVSTPLRLPVSYIHDSSPRAFG